MNDRDIRVRAHHARHVLAMSGNTEDAQAVTDLIEAWSEERTRANNASKDIEANTRAVRYMDGALQDIRAEVKKVGSLLGWDQGTDMVSALYPAVEDLVLKADELTSRRSSNPLRPSQAALDTAFEAMAARLEEVMEENTRLAAQIDGEQEEWTTAIGAAQS